MKISNIKLPIFLVLLIVASILSFFSNWWLGELAVSLTQQWALLGGGLIIYNLLKKRWLIVALCLPITIWHGEKVSWVAADNPNVQLAERDVLVRVLQHNVFRYYDADEKEVEWLKNIDNQYDLVLLQETELRIDAMFPELLEHYPYQVRANFSKNFDNVLLSKYPIINSEIRHFLNSKTAYLRAVIALPEEELVVYGLHTTSTFMKLRYDKRNSQLAHIAQEVANDLSPNKIIVGDLNVTPYSNIFKQLVKNSKLNNSFIGWGNINSFPAFSIFNMLQTPIDHLLYSDGMTVLHKAKSKAIFSDHYAIETVLSINNGIKND